MFDRGSRESGDGLILSRVPVVTGDRAEMAPWIGASMGSASLMLSEPWRKAPDPSLLEFHDRRTPLDLCVAISRTLQAALPSPVRPDAILVCTTSLESDDASNPSSVLRLQCEYGLSANSFSIGSQDSAAFFTALAISGNIFAVDPRVQTALICCAEGWADAVTRQYGDMDPFGDAAAAILVAREGEGWRLRAVETRSIPEFPDPLDHAPVLGDLRKFALVQAELIDALLEAEGLAAGDIDHVVGSCFHDDVAMEVEALCGFAAIQVFAPRYAEAGYLCSADPAVRLHCATTDHDGRNGDLMLLWGAGVTGSFGVALFEYGR